MAKASTQVVGTTLSDSNIVTSVEETKKVKEKPDTDEVAFLKLLHRLQNDGKFGTHLNELIDNRIKQLTSK